MNQVIKLIIVTLNMTATLFCTKFLSKRFILPSNHSTLCVMIHIYIYIVQSADMHVLAFNASSVQLGTRLDTRYLRIYTHERALTKRMWYNTKVSTHPDMRRV